MHNVIGKIYTNYIYIILLILLYDVQNGLTQLNPYFQFIPQNDNLHTKIYDYSKGFDEDHFTYELQYPIPIYETLIKKINIRKNGLLALDSISDDNLPPNYPVNTSITNQRLQDFDGRYLSIFSSVNDGKRGRISVTEIDLLSPSKLPCVERMQIDRLIKFIHLSYIEESELKAQYIVHILWENMTNAYLINQKANTYGMIIISNGICSYAFMQYIKIEWNENDVAENLALPPESGIFMRPFGGYQLPRSSQAVEPNIWLTETNIALHGEWLVPLYKSENIAKINVKNLSAVASEFVASLTSVCEGSLHSRKSNNETPSDTVVIKNVNIDNTSEEPIARTQSFKRALESLENYDLNVSANDYSYGMTENVPKAAWNILRDETEFSGVDPIDQNEMNILPENETANNFYHESNQRVVDNEEYTPTDTITTQTYYPLGRYDGDEERQEIHEPLIVPVTIHPLGDEDDGEEDIIDNKEEYKSVNETFSNSLVKCDAVSECSSHNTECYRVDNAACCVCSDGFYGAGDAKCWSEVNDHKFSFSGSLTTRFGIENTSSPLLIYLDIQHGSLRRSSSGIRGGRTNDRIYSTMRLITPVFHILNSMVSSPCENIPKRERVYNLFTLGNGLQRPFKVLFQFDIERVGKFTIQAVLELHDFTTGAYANGVIQLEAFSTESLNLLDQSYIEAYSASDKPDKTYYANYKIDDHGRVVFPEQTVKFIVEHRDSNEISNFPEEINVHWSAVAESESCLLKQVSSIPKNKSYYIRLKDRGYCSEDCSSPDGTCNLFCVDEPLLLATEPSPCDCVTCDRHGEVCRPEGASYRCECGQGLKLMPDNTCQATSLVDVTNYLGVQCGSVNCHTHARCIDPNQAFCQCLPGYRGDGVSHCESDPCSKCRRNEICENGICIASGVDLCEGIQCGEQAFCQDGACVCTPGYTGDPVVKCYEERDRCFQVRCHPNAQCYNNECHCVEGFQGDGYYDCKPVVYDPCSEVRCHPYAKCRNGNCECLPDYYGDGYHVCKPRNYDQCQNIRCHEFANCQNGRCQCNAGYEGDGYWECKSIKSDQCQNIRCHEFANCQNGRCQCNAGYEGDGYWECKSIKSDPCSSMRCHINAKCFDGECRCLDGYQGDGKHYCDPIQQDQCQNIRCHEFANCQNGRCQCNAGYEGDGYWECKSIKSDLCKYVRCHENAKCNEQGKCQCLDGYSGDGYYECQKSSQELCAGVQCHRFGQCYENRCYCSHGYVGDGVNFCDARANDPCDGVRCAANGRCQDGRCVCDPGYTGDGYNECREAEGVKLCGNVQCHQYATCDRGQCRCVTGYDGDGYSDCRPVTEDKCSRMRCHPDAQCTDGYCFCPTGFEGDGYYECKRITQDRCANVRCHENAKCDDGYCRCKEGFEGDGYSECRRKSEDRDPCARIRCHPQAQCEYGFCRCKNGYKGDGYWNCQPIQSDLCRAEQCHQFARCVEGQCRCLDGYEGDGYQMCNIIPGATSADCGNCNGIPFKEIAQCVGGRCVCARGFIEVQAGVCMECVQDNCHQDAVCRPDDRFNGAYSCHCKSGFTGDGVSVCKPESVGREDATSSQAIDPTCGGGCRIRNAECDRYTGTCKCRSGYDGDGERGCYWNCKLCHPSAICDRENERCICPSGYRGDGQTFCEQIPVRQDSIKVRIMGEGEVMHITDISHPLELRCFVTGSDQSYSGQWIQPHSAQEPIVTKTRQQDGYEISLRINQPTITDSGRYECRAGNVAAFIDVNVEESAIPFTVLLTSDDGILMTQSTDSNVTKATLWNIAENNKYGRVSMVGDCNSQRIIYTSDYGHTIRWGNSNSGQNKLVTKEIYTSQINRFRNLAVDSLSGNVFAWEEAFGKIMVFNPNKPNIHYTLESLHSLTSSEQQNFAGLALHSTLGLMYWAIYTDGWRPNGTIQVASMSGENEEQLLQLTGEPLAISISPATPVNGNSAGKLCWMQRSSKGMFGLVTELHCARLGQTGREILTNEKIREFSPSEEPSFGMTQYKGTLLWTDASKTVYYSINPDRRIRVRYVCCSNRFQAISVLGDCPQASTNPCTYSNGRCRYICLPNDGGRSRTCVCPDNEPGCHKEM
ncbi:unnamed protein product [Schistosoma margrebowiei]|uniref:EGF-like domain-containing protein n=1 Tax=Schistosoma margrebowiei TaxID=48269 RepID=A0AA84ZP27_9TREM|nr:unnamed protein product [Schistosoma margrebowiei]CAH8480460.1 unnamed protein product [Schistosoma margrebowiei]